jgi:uncharacterized membrane protein YdfJ with MMPL/SSD domain
MSAAMRAPRRTVVAAALVLVIAGVVAAPVTRALQPFSSEDPGSQSVAARRAIERATGIDPYFSLVALVPTPSGAASPASRRVIARVRAAMAADSEIAAVRSFDPARTPQLRSRDGRATLVVGALRARPISTSLDAARRVEERLSSLPGVKVGGLAAFYAQGNDTARSDLIRAEALAFPLLLLIALWIFRGVVAAMLPLVVGALTIVGTLAVLRLASELTNVSIYALNIATALGLGLAVDYSLLIVSRYREEAARAGPGAATLRRTMDTAGRTILVSSITVAGVLSSLLAFPQPFLRSIGLGGILVAAIAGASSLIVLPAILTLLGSRVDALSLPRWRRAAHRSARATDVGVWHRLSQIVVRRPWPIAGLGAALMLLLSSPALSLQITQVDARVVPAGSGARVVDEEVQRRFPATAHAPIFISVRAGTHPAERAGVAAYARRLRALPGIASVEGPRAISPHIWQIDVVPLHAPLSPASQELVREIRRTPAPAPALAGGESASLVDLKHSLLAHIPLALVILLAVTGAAVLWMTGSAVLPVVALAVGALTITATYGALVLVFQHGWLEGLLDYTGSQAIEASTLVLIFAMSFGLATDYGIFVLSRIKELRARGLGDADAVAGGLERTGRVITAAALLLCVALGSLMTARHALVKEVGFGAALAVAIDATVVRALLLPSVVRLLGRAAWLGPPGISAARLGRATWRRRASLPAAVKLAPSRTVTAARADALAATPQCDHWHPTIEAALAQVRERATGADERSIAVAAFEFVRDEIPYTLGPWGVPASVTMQRREGMCTNKANLLVALLRRAEIPAAYGVLRVNARDYFGVIGPPFLTRYMARESTHVYAAPMLDGRWVKCDPSTDRDMASRTSHFCKQTVLMEWDGRADSLDFLDPHHVYADLGLFADIGELLDKPARGATAERLTLWNDYLAFIRANPPYSSSESLIAAYSTREQTHRLLQAVDGSGDGVRPDQDGAAGPGVATDTSEHFGATREIGG